MSEHTLTKPASDHDESPQDETPRNETLVTVATFPEPMEANMARMALESAGIAVFLRGENANSMVPVAFESELQVRASDEAAARKLLDDMETSPPSESAVTAAELADEAARGGPTLSRLWPADLAACAPRS